jgi:sugar phosphate permease
MSAAYVPCTATAVKWFRHRRGLAVGIAGSGANLGIAGVPPLSEALIARFGWRQTYLLFGIVVLVLINILAVFVVRDPETLGLQPDGEGRRTPLTGIAPPGTEDASAWTFGEAVRTIYYGTLASCPP